jgi:hypothetical protein
MRTEVPPRCMTAAQQYSPPASPVIKTPSRKPFL